jgi:hypothetical protein
MTNALFGPDLAGRRRGCSDFYPAAEVSLGAGLILPIMDSMETARTLSVPGSANAAGGRPTVNGVCVQTGAT